MEVFITNISSRNISLNGRHAKVRLPIGGFAKLSGEEWSDIKQSKIVECMIAQRMIHVSDSGLKGDVALNPKSSLKEKPEHLKVEAEKLQSAPGQMEPEPVKAVKVSPPATKQRKGEQVKAEIKK